jgi:hypothetical protein
MDQAALEAKGAPTVAALDSGSLHRRGYSSPFARHIQLFIWLRAACLLLLLLTNAPRERLIVVVAPVRRWLSLSRSSASARGRRQWMHRTTEGQSHDGKHGGCAEDLRVHNLSVSCRVWSSMRLETPAAGGTTASGSEQLAEGTVAERRRNSCFLSFAILLCVLLLPPPLLCCPLRDGRFAAGGCSAQSPSSPKAQHTRC